MTGFWKISPNVTFYNSNIYIQNEKWELPINLIVVTICISQLELPENNFKSSIILCCCHNKLCNSMYFNVTLRPIFQNCVTNFNITRSTKSTQKAPFWCYTALIKCILRALNISVSQCNQISESVKLALI